MTYDTISELRHYAEENKENLPSDIYNALLDISDYADMKYISDVEETSKKFIQGYNTGVKDTTEKITDYLKKVIDDINTVLD